MLFFCLLFYLGFLELSCSMYRSSLRDPSLPYYMHSLDGDYLSAASLPSLPSSFLTAIVDTSLNQLFIPHRARPLPPPVLPRPLALIRFEFDSVDCPIHPLLEFSAIHSLILLVLVHCCYCSISISDSSCCSHHLFTLPSLPVRFLRCLSPSDRMLLHLHGGVNVILFIALQSLPRLPPLHPFLLFDRIDIESALLSSICPTSIVSLST